MSESQSAGLPRNFLGIAIEGPSREGFFFYPTYRLGEGASEYARGADLPRILPDGVTHQWTLRYSAGAAAAPGRITVTLDEQTVSLDVPAEHKAAGAGFDRFGIVSTWIDGNGQHVYLDDLSYTWRQP